MPFAAPHPCPGFGPRKGKCPKIVAYGEPCCDECRRFYEVAKRENVKRWQISKREESHPNYRTAKWQHVRSAYLSRKPLCERCEAMGLTTPARIVDHIIPIKQGGDWFVFSNLQSLCISCHASKTADDKRRYGGADGRTQAASYGP